MVGYNICKLYTICRMDNYTRRFMVCATVRNGAECNITLETTPLKSLWISDHREKRTRRATVRNVPVCKIINN